MAGAGVRMAAEEPDVTFVVPCYKLGHLLRDCLASIASQTHRSLEVLVMDDQSPDETPEVARSFGDPRVRHVRNERNLGHLRNYNQGIALARGRYVWLISADDYLRRPDAVERYVTVLDTHPAVGYAFCPAVRVQDGVEMDVLGYSAISPRDRIYPGRSLLRGLLRGNVVPAASGMVRRELYDRLGAFPLDLPWAGDWYLWSLFAMFSDVAFFAEPMVCYRKHVSSMTTALARDKVKACCEEEARILWTLKANAEQARLHGVARECLRALAERYAEHVAEGKFGSAEPPLTLDEVEQSIRAHASGPPEGELVQALALAEIGNIERRRGHAGAAAGFYDLALRRRPRMPKARLERELLRLGAPGRLLRRLVSAVAPRLA
jgi:hypothetical protein